MESVLSHTDSSIPAEIANNNTARAYYGLALETDGTIWIKAPFDTSSSKIEEKVRKRVAWIVRQQRYFESFDKNIPERRYISGESHGYLGRQYRLYVKKASPTAFLLMGIVLKWFVHPNLRRKV